MKSFEEPDVEAFLSEINEVCRRHNMMLEPENILDSIIIRRGHAGDVFEESFIVLDTPPGTTYRTDGQIGVKTNSPTES